MRKRGCPAHIPDDVHHLGKKALFPVSFRKQKNVPNIYRTKNRNVITKKKVDLMRRFTFRKFCDYFIEVVGDPKAFGGKFIFGMRQDGNGPFISCRYRDHLPQAFIR